MSLKSIDLQMALSRTTQAGQQQQYTMHKPQDDQAALALTGQKLAEHKQHRSEKAEESGKSDIHDSRERRGGDPGRRHARDSEQEASQPTSAEHPYLGHHFDLST